MSTSSTQKYTGGNQETLQQNHKSTHMKEDYGCDSDNKVSTELKTGMHDLIQFTVDSIDIKEIENMYSQVEKDFVDLLGSKFKEKWSGINFGHELLGVFANWCIRGGNIPPEFFQSSNQQLQERYIRMILCTDEFPQLHIQDQFTLLRNNLQLVEVLTYIRSYNFDTADEELDNVFGDLDKKIWSEVRHQVPARRMSDMSQGMPFQENNRIKFITLMNKCQSKIITDQNIFSIITAILLFSSDGINFIDR